MKNVFVLGELNADLIMSGSDVTPEWNREKMVDSFNIVMGSSSAITACGLAGLGLNVYFVTVVGTDQLGEFCIDQLQQKGVNTSYVIKDASLKTGATLSLSTEKDRALLTYMGAISELKPAHIPEALFQKADHVHFGSYYLQKQMQPHWKELFQRCQEQGIHTSFDLGWDPEQQWHKEEVLDLLPYTDLFIPSEDEVKQVLECEHIEQVVSRLSRPQRITAIKRGADGAVLLERAGDKKTTIRTDLPAFDIVPVDTTGAGDSFNAGLIYSFLHGLTGKELLLFASACGAMAALRVGGASKVPNVEEVERFMNQTPMKDQ